MADEEDKLGRLERLSKLKEEGAIRPAEFEQMKAEILGSATGNSSANRSDSVVHELPDSPKVDDVERLVKAHGLAGAAQRMGVLAAELDGILKKRGIRARSWKLQASTTKANHIRARRTESEFWKAVPAFVVPVASLLILHN